MLSKISSLIVFALIAACQADSSSKGTQQDVELGKKNRDSLLLQSILEDFLSDKRVKSDVITLQSIKSNDSLRFIMMDGYPDLTAAAFLGYSLIKNRKVCIVGDSIPPGSIKIDFNDVPVEVTDLNNKVMNSKELVIINAHPLVQSVCFKGMNLIECPSIDDPLLNKE